jgi:hypothetical protein
MQEKDLDAIIDLSALGLTFRDKPLIVGGLAMEYYGLRPHGDDIDFIVSDRDYRTARAQYPEYRKDIWADFGISVKGFELFRSIYRLDYGHYCRGSVEFARLRMVPVDTLFRMKVFALDAGEKHRADVELLKKYYQRFENPAYAAVLNAHADRYLAVPGGLILNGPYDDDLLT